MNSPHEHQQPEPESALERDNPRSKKNTVPFIIGIGALIATTLGITYFINLRDRESVDANKRAALYESYRQKDAEDHRKQLNALQAQLTNYQHQLNVALQTRPGIGTVPPIEELVAVTKLVEGGLFVPSFEGGGLAALTVSNSNKGPVVMGDTRVVTYTRNPLNGLLDTKDELVELGKGFYHLFNDQVVLAPTAFYTFATDNGLSSQDIVTLTDNADMNYLNALATASYVFAQNAPWFPMSENMRSIAGTNNTYTVLGSRKAINELRGKR